MEPDLQRTRRLLTLRYGLFASGLLVVFALGVYGQVSSARRDLQRQEVAQLASTAAAHLSLLHHEFDELRLPARRLHAPVPLIAPFATVEIHQDHKRIRWFDDRLHLIAAIGTFQPRGATLPSPERRGREQWLPLQNGLAYWRPVFSRQAGSRTPRLEGYVSVELASVSREAELGRLRQGLAIGGLLAGLLAFAASQWMVAASLRPIRDQLQRLIRFSADASHELRHPLTAIRALIGSLRHGASLTGCPAAVPRQLALIDQATTHMGRLVDDLLLLTRSDRALEDQRDLHPFPLEELVEDLVALHHQEAAAQGVELRAQVEGPALVRGHPQRLRRLLENLIANALRFSPPGGTVTLGLELQRGWVRLWVDDQGPGIPVEQRQQVFERFWQADPARSGSEHHGLGLSIAQAIAQGHRARLSAQEAPGGGARLLLELPRFCSS